MTFASDLPDRNGSGEGVAAGMGVVVGKMPGCGGAKCPGDTELLEVANLGCDTEFAFSFVGIVNVLGPKLLGAEVGTGKFSGGTGCASPGGGDNGMGVDGKGTAAGSSAEGAA